jgi:hypothetical protein
MKYNLHLSRVQSNAVNDLADRRIQQRTCPYFECPTLAGICADEFAWGRECLSCLVLLYCFLIFALSDERLGGQKFFQDLVEIERRSVTDRGKAFIVRNVDMWSEIMCCEFDIDFEALVAEYPFFLAEYWVCEFGMEFAHYSEIVRTGLHDRDLNCLVGIGRP